ncbi:PKD domain-containing protein [Candidatus Woesearchaeota archaeon]|nr:PKD domain-containing protein [Candidatus Woesearchaeota archaeon]
MAKNKQGVSTMAQGTHSLHTLFTFGSRVMLFCMIILSLAMSAEAITTTGYWDVAGKPQSLDVDFGEDARFYYNVCSVKGQFEYRVRFLYEDDVLKEILVPEQNYVGSCKSDFVTITDDTYQDEEEDFIVEIWGDDGAKSTKKLYLTVNDNRLPNEPPELDRSLPDVSFNEDERLTDEFDLDDYFSDEDPLSYSARGNTHVKVSIDGGNKVDFWADPNWSGSEDVTFTASDGELSVSDTIRVTVLPVNDPPFLTQPITDVSFNEDQQVNDQFDLDNHFDDIDSAVLSYSVENTNHVHVLIDADNNVSFSADADWSGSEDITFRASDGQYSVSDTMKVTVRPVNDPPVKTRSLPDVTFNEDERVNDVFDLDDYFRDTDSTLHYYAEDTIYVHLLIDAQNKVDFWADANWNGNEKVVFVAYDEYSEVSDEILVTVRPVNDPPLKPSNPDPFVGETNVIINHDLSWQSGDIDGDTITYDIYFGTTPYPPKVRSNHPSKSYDPGTMLYETQYYWKIVARDSNSAETAGDLWYFTTEEQVITNQPPVVTDIGGYTNPDSGLINFTAQAADPDLGDRVEQVEFQVKVDEGLSMMKIGQGDWVTKCVDTREPWNCAWDSTQEVPTKTEVEVRARAYDGELWGNYRTEGPFTVDNDREAPVITLITPQNNARVSGVDVDFTYKAEDTINALSSCTLYVDGSSKGRHSNPQESTPLTFSDVDLVDGTHQWWVNCTDTAPNPNEGKSQVWNLYVNHSLSDRSPPVVQLLSPPNNEIVEGVDVQFMYNVTDLDSGIASCNLYLNGVLDQTDSSIREAIPQTFVKRYLADGTYKWNVSCTDDSLNRNVGYSTTWTLHVDHSLGNLPPVVTDIGGYTDPDSGLINFTAQAADPDLGDRVEQVEFQVKVDDGFSMMKIGQGDWVTKCVDTREPWNCAWDSTQEVPTKAEVEVRARAYDGELWGNYRTEGPFTVDNDREAPVITLITPQNNARVSGVDVDFTYEAEDTINALSSCTLYVDGTSKGTHRNPQESTPLTFSDVDLVDGTHQWWVNCTDTAPNPNEGKSEVWNLYVNHSLGDHNAPVVQLLAPPNNKMVEGVNVRFVYNVTDLDSGIASCNLYLNGVLDQTDTSITENLPQTFVKGYLADGTYKWNVSCTDDSLRRNVGYSETRTLHVNHSLENHAPVVTDIANYTDPDSGFINFSIEAYDPDLWDHVEQVKLDIYFNGSYHNEICVDTVEPWNCEWNSTEDIPTKDERVKLRAWAFDGELWSEPYKEYWITIDNDFQAPLITLIAPENNAELTNTSVDFTYSVFDEISNISSCSLVVDNSVTRTTVNPPEQTALTFADVALTPGTHTWYVNCTDGSFNVNTGKSEVRSLTMSGVSGNLPPVASFMYDPAQPFVDDLVTFNGSLSSDPDNDTLTYSWDFTNDGIEDANTVVATYTFRTAGIYPVALTVSDGALSDIERQDVVVSDKEPGQLNITELSCFERVVVNHNQSCSVFVEAEGVPTGNAQVSLFYNDGTFIDSCQTNNISGACAVLYPVTEEGNYTVYAEASKVGYLPDKDTEPDFTYRVFAERYDIQNLATYNDTAFTQYDDDFFRGQNLYTKFRIYDLVEEQYVSDAVSSSTLVSNDGGGRADLSVYQTLNDTWYYYTLLIPLTHDFIGDSNVFAFTFNDLNQSGGQEQTPLFIRNNPPLITPPVGPITTDLEEAVTIDLTQHEFDLEDSGNDLSWDVEGVNETIASVHINEQKVLTITPRAVGVDSFTLMLRDLDGDAASEEIFLTIGEPNPTFDPIAIPGGPYVATAGATLVVDGSKSYDPDGGNITRYDWNWGDSSSHSGSATPSHVYKEEGTYTITLRVWDDEDEQGIATTKVVVNAGDTVSDRDKYPQRKLHISEVRILPEVTKPGSEVVVLVTVKNDGLRDEDSIKIEAVMPEWGEWQSRIQEDVDDGDSITERFVFTVPPSQRRGTYTLRVAVVTEDLVKRVLYRDIIVH